MDDLAREYILARITESCGQKEMNPSMVCSRNGDNRRIRKAKGYRLKYGEIFSKDWVKSEYKKREHEKRLEGAERASAMFTSAMAKTEARRYIKQHEKEKHED